ncbi:hypothetical protein C2U42_07715 [Klebsiella oxytoca]|nr:hypothetical protein C2U42_07715 [Klebsiella oxytoca]
MPRRSVAAASTRLALRLAGLQVHHRLRAGSPGKAFMPQPGECAAMWHCCGFYPACAALSRATVHHRLRAGSPGKAFTPQPGECAATWHCCGFYPLALRLAGLPGHRLQITRRYCERLQPFLVADTFSGSRMTGTPTTALSGAVVFSQGTLLRYQQLML